MGVIGGRMEVEGGVKRLYITVIAVLAAYRGRGLGELHAPPARTMVMCGYLLPLPLVLQAKRC